MCNKKFFKKEIGKSNKTSWIRFIDDRLRVLKYSRFWNLSFYKILRKKYETLKNVHWLIFDNTRPIPWPTVHQDLMRNESVEVCRVNWLIDWCLTPYRQYFSHLTAACRCTWNNVYQHTCINKYIHECTTKNHSYAYALLLTDEYLIWKKSFRSEFMHVHSVDAHLQ